MALSLAPGLFARLLEPGDRELGELGERLAARELARRGWRVLGRRVRTPTGEVDLVAKRADVLLALEVKTSRSSAPRSFRPADRFGCAAQRRQQRALEWLADRLGHRGTRALGVCEVFAPSGARARMRFELLGDAPRARTFHLDPPGGR